MCEDVISAIVINWNGRDYLEGCLQALIEQVPPPEEVLLVDNHSDDGSREFVAERFPEVKILDTGSNHGPARARNLGVQAAGHEFCLLLDNDVVLQPGALAEMRRVLGSDDRLGMVQARSLLADQPEVVHYDGADLHFLGILVLHNWYRPLVEVEPGDRSLGAGVALCFLMRRALYLELGGFYERLFILYEDNEFSWRLRMAGYRISLASSAHCLHRQGTTGLSLRTADADYSSRRSYLHCRNRWLTLLACMRLRTLALTAPAQVLYAIVYTCFAITRGHLFAAIMGHVGALRGIPSALQRRRSIRGLRKVADRDLLVAKPMTLNPGLADRGLAAALRRGMDRLLACYWRWSRSLCG